MCGIVGMIDTSQGGFFAADKQVFLGMLLLNSFRGAHSTGVAGILKSGDVDVMKVLGHPFELNKWKAAEEFYGRLEKRYWGLIGHGRLATQGEIKIQNAHPFWHKGLTLVHNGTLSNFETLQKDLGTSFEVDSELVCYMVSEFGLEEALKHIRGAYTLVFADSRDNSINMVRNHERPLVVGTYNYPDRLAFASERHVLKWAAEKGHSMKEIADLPVLEWRKYTRNGVKMEVTKTTIKPYASQHYTGGHNYYNSPKHTMNQWLGQDIEHMYEDEVVTQKISTPPVSNYPTYKPATLEINGKAYFKDDIIHFNMLDAIDGYDSEGLGFCSLKGVCTADTRVQVASHFKGSSEEVMKLFSEGNPEWRMTGRILSYHPLPNDKNSDFRVYVGDVKEYPPKAEVAAPAQETKSNGHSSTTLYLPAPKQGSDQKPDGNVSEVSNVVELAPKNVPMQKSMLKVAGGTFFSEKRFKALAALGCKLCTAHPTVEEAMETVIATNPLTKDTEMFCPTCTKQFSYDVNLMRAMQ